ncbi:ribosome biogenesis GTP-binding protein YihA/YsxC [Shimazuella alba]|uniref:Probable GTP-binding protein EngB n=1 Tax=Shimazuella alba TaxID=2690964 RepID=A0A6I4W132_9BACL|nr:ribosome biogenesis GTP-binding protein YihA/YsxC [Shimazuella alba]MXQ55895.1 YihA family ribosome biogenesis GTP-binding protein [Shimazuella alba]
MKITQVEFMTSAVLPDQYPTENRPEIALSGRSNVGKSSLINCLVNRKNIARISSKPGKTQTINFFLVNESVVFADVPGYGFAKVSKKIRESWGKMMETYFTKRENLVSVVQIVDLRHPPSKDDQNMYQFLKHYQIPVIVAATKADKLPKSKWHKHLKVVKEVLQMDSSDALILFSAETKMGKEELLAEIQQRIGQSVEE